MPNYLQAGPVCSAPIDVETTITVLIICLKWPFKTHLLSETYHTSHSQPVSLVSLSFICTQSSTSVIQVLLN